MKLGLSIAAACLASVAAVGPATNVSLASLEQQNAELRAELASQSRDAIVQRSRAHKLSLKIGALGSELSRETQKEYALETKLNRVRAALSDDGAGGLADTASVAVAPPVTNVSAARKVVRAHVQSQSAETNSTGKTNAPLPSISSALVLQDDLANITSDSSPSNQSVPALTSAASALDPSPSNQSTPALASAASNKSTALSGWLATNVTDSDQPVTAPTTDRNSVNNSVVEQPEVPAEQESGASADADPKIADPEVAAALAAADAAGADVDAAAREVARATAAPTTHAPTTPAPTTTTTSTTTTTTTSTTTTTAIAPATTAPAVAADTKRRTGAAASSATAPIADAVQADGSDFDSLEKSLDAEDARIQALDEDDKDDAPEPVIPAPPKPAAPQSARKTATVVAKAAPQPEHVFEELARPPAEPPYARPAAVSAPSLPAALAAEDGDIGSQLDKEAKSDEKFLSQLLRSNPGIHVR